MHSLSKDALTKGKPLVTTFWQWGDTPPLTGCGAQELLGLELMAFFASRQCPGVAIRAAMDWALQQARARQVVISGFHSPLEQSVLKVLIAANSPVVVVLARAAHSAKLPPEWRDPLSKGHMAVISASDKSARITAVSSEQRNRLAAQLAHNIVVAHASVGGQLARLHDEWCDSGRSITRLDIGS